MNGLGHLSYASWSDGDLQFKIFVGLTIVWVPHISGIKPLLEIQLEWFSPILSPFSSPCWLSSLRVSVRVCAHTCAEVRRQHVRVCSLSIMYDSETKCTSYCLTASPLSAEPAHQPPYRLVFDKSTKHAHWPTDNLCSKPCWGKCISTYGKEGAFLTALKINWRCERQNSGNTGRK